MTALELPHLWFTAGTNDQLWGPGLGATYGEVPYEALPPLGPFDGTFQWLTMPAAGVEVLEEARSDGLGAEQIDATISRVRDARLALPTSFLTLMTDADLRSRIPSCTACYFDLGSRLVAIPGHDGPERLFRFMNDQQACLLWYLLLEPAGVHRVVCAWPEWREDEAADSLDDAIDPRDLEGELRTYMEAVARARSRVG